MSREQGASSRSRNRANRPSAARLRLRDVLLKTIHYYVLFFVLLMRRRKTRIEGKIPKQKCIFVANHFCSDDIPTAISVLKKHFYVLVDAIDRYNVNGLMLRFNGVVWVDRADRADRRSAAEEMTEHIRLGHRVLVYPEGLWNVTPHLPVLPLYGGAVRMSQQTGVPIVPVYFLFRDGECRCKIGDAFYPADDTAQAVAELRDRMATAYDDLLGQFPPEKRDDLPEGYWRAQVLKRCGAYSVAKKDPAAYLAREDAYLYRPKGVVPPEEAFAHLRRLRPCGNNAFLLNRNLSYDGSAGASGASVLEY